MIQEKRNMSKCDTMTIFGPTNNVIWRFLFWENYFESFTGQGRCSIIR